MYCILILTNSITELYCILEIKFWVLSLHVQRFYSECSNIEN